jgi:hypothetical protein
MSTAIPPYSSSGCASQNDLDMVDESPDKRKGTLDQDDPYMVDKSPNKRKRAIDDDGDRELKNFQLGGHRLGIEEINLDCIYQICSLINEVRDGKLCFGQQS